MPAKQSNGQNKGRDVEMAHFQGRLYECARKLLGRKPRYYLKGEALDLGLANDCRGRKYDKPEWLEGAALERAIRAVVERARRDFTPESTSSPNGTNHPFSVEDDDAKYFEYQGAIWHRRFTSNGASSAEPLTNFVAHIAREWKYDDGIGIARTYEVEAVVRGHKLAVTLPAADFGSLTWVDEKLGGDAIVNAGSGTKDHTRAAIKFLSLGHPCETR